MLGGNEMHRITALEPGKVHKIVADGEKTASAGAVSPMRSEQFSSPCFDLDVLRSKFPHSAQISSP